MSTPDSSLSARVIAHLVDLSASRCSITEEDLLAEPDEGVREILGGLMLLHEELEFRERKRQQALAELAELAATLEERVAVQAQAILQLSTPVLEIWPGILVLPLVGAVDTARAQQLTEQALGAVAQRAAAVLILDVTGVPVIDTGVARHLLDTVAAVALLGARVILSGVSPTNAQALVRLGVDLSRIQTGGSLHASLRIALALTRRAIVDRPAR